MYKIQPIRDYLVNARTNEITQPDILVRAKSLREALGKVSQQFGVPTDALFACPA